MNILKAALIFQDYCMIQRQKPVRIWGTSVPGHQVTAVLEPHSVHGTADPNGNWEVWFSPMEACTDTRLEILDQESGERLTFSHIAVGEVWVAGGQSNMEFLLKYDEDRYGELRKEPNRSVRYFEVPHIAFEQDPMDISASGIWRLCDRENMEYFSAVGYYFAADLEAELHVPVGIVACNWGGTSALTWIPKEKFLTEDALKKYWAVYENTEKDLDLESYQSLVMKCRHKMNELSKTRHQQIRHGLSRLDQLKFVQENSLEEYGLVPPLPMGPWHQNSPGRLYESMLLRIAGMSTRGILWYQGESDVERKGDYDTLFLAVIESWRALWKEELPWLFVQLAPFYKWLSQDGSGFPVIRQKQDLISKTVPKTWMACIMDYGMKWGIHPTRKKYVGKRLCLLALGKVYQKPILCESPECIRAERKENGIVLTFTLAGDGLLMYDEVQRDLYVICDDENGKTKIEITRLECRGNTVLIPLEPQTPHISHVEYLNVPFGEAMLYNSAGLPAKPFIIAVEPESL